MIKAHEVKHRAFYGNTSMESEMGLLQAGQALVSPLNSVLCLYLACARQDHLRPLRWHRFFALRCGPLGSVRDGI